jgi:hypothetical protein
MISRFRLLNSRVIFSGGNWPGFHLFPALWAVLGRLLVPFIVYRYVFYTKDFYQL